MGIGLLFNGQGSQSQGMGRDFYDAYPYVRAMYEKASDVLGYDIRQLIDEEPEKLDDTLYTQPTIVLVSLTIYEVIKREIGLKPLLASGFSLGEYSALAASGVFSFSDILYLIKERARLMEEASRLTKGKMAAVIGLDAEELLSYCNQVSDEQGIVTIANYNCPGQLVVSGHAERVAQLERLLEGKAKRVVPVNVSGAFHSPLMMPAAEGLKRALTNVSVQPPQFPVIMNVHAEPLEIERLMELMVKQVYSPVRFEDSLRRMIRCGVKTFIEIGPGRVLSGFIRRIDRTIPVISIQQVEDLKQLESVGGERHEFRG